MAISQEYIEPFRLDERINDLEVAKSYDPDNDFIVQRIDRLIKVFLDILYGTVQAQEILECFQLYKEILNSEIKFGETIQKTKAMEASQMMMTLYITALDQQMTALEKEKVQENVKTELEAIVEIKNGNIKLDSSEEESVQEVERNLEESFEKADEVVSAENQVVEATHKRKDISFERRLQGATWIEENVSTNYSSYNISQTLKDFFEDFKNLPLGGYEMVSYTLDNVKTNLSLSDRITARIITNINGYRHSAGLPMVTTLPMMADESKSFYETLSNIPDEELETLASLGDDIRAYGLGDYIFRKSILPNDNFLEDVKKIKVLIFVKKYRNERLESVLTGNINEYFFTYTIESE